VSELIDNCCQYKAIELELINKCSNSRMFISCVIPCNSQEEPRIDSYRNAVQPTQAPTNGGIPEGKLQRKKKLKKTREELELLKDELDMVGCQAKIAYLLLPCL